MTRKSGVAGEQSLKRSTLNALKISKEEGRDAVHSLKSDLGLRNDFHGKIMGNGDYLDPSNDNLLGNIYDYVR